MTKDKSEVLSITLNMNGNEYANNLAEDLQIHEDNLNADFCDQPAKFAWYAVLSAKAKHEASLAKFELDKMEEYIKKTLIGELDAEVRHNLEFEGEKITESKVEKAIYKHSKYKEQVEKLNELKLEWLDKNHTAVLLEFAKEAMMQRKDMLISIGANLRAQMENTDLSIRKENIREVYKKAREAKERK